MKNIFIILTYFFKNINKMEKYFVLLLHKAVGFVIILL